MTSAQLLVVVVIVECDNYMWGGGGILLMTTSLLLLLCSALSPLTFSSIAFSNSASTCDTAHVWVMIGIGGASKRVRAYLWCGSQMAGGGFLWGSTGPVDSGVEPRAAAGSRGGVGCHEMMTRGWWCARVCLGMYGGCVVAVGTAWGVKARRSTGMKG
ncbi:hypothetical protein K439DRAFT_1643473 [Ramaria rubella]|nr:hypothetical protein K439DRAFT_1643473 [Ramaria rubella]